MPGSWNPRAEAEWRLGGRYEARVLEPSPPALDDNRDDPTARGVLPPGRRLVSPVSDGDIPWDRLAREEPELADWCADRWLGAWRPLAPPPASLVETRVALHRLAERVVSPARRVATGNEISLRYTHRGFGTPFYRDDEQVRVEATELVVHEGDSERRGPLTSLRAAAELVGTLDAEGLDDEPLPIDPSAAHLLGDWFGFVTLVVAELRARAGEGMEPATINLWPEHFDVATELGSEADGVRAGYGGSPGDGEHAEPYLYVAPWAARPGGKLWNARAFPGAELSYSELLAAPNQVAAGIEFLEARLRALTG